MQKRAFCLFSLLMIGSRLFSLVALSFCHTHTIEANCILLDRKSSAAMHMEQTVAVLRNISCGAFIIKYVEHFLALLLWPSQQHSSQVVRALQANARKIPEGTSHPIDYGHQNRSFALICMRHVPNVVGKQLEGPAHWCCCYTSAQLVCSKVVSCKSCFIRVCVCVLSKQ